MKTLSFQSMEWDPYLVDISTEHHLIEYDFPAKSHECLDHLPEMLNHQVDPLHTVGFIDSQQYFENGCDKHL